MLSIDVCEEGGARTKTGSGKVVCGLSGKALKPYYVPRSGHLACGLHAHFSVPNAVIVVTGYNDENVVTIEEYRIVRDSSNIARIQSRVLWHGLSKLPGHLSRFQAATNAAKEKGSCYHCRCVHYADFVRL